jgi:hypothetical protein
MPPAGFEPSIPASERPQTHALDRATTRTGALQPSNIKFHENPPGGPILTTPFNISVLELRNFEEKIERIINLTSIDDDDDNDDDIIMIYAFPNPSIIQNPGTKTTG